MTTLPPRSRLLKLAQLTSTLFSTTFNPTGVRTGNRILRQRLKGPSLASYYPRAVVKIKDLKRAFPMARFVDEEEKGRVADVVRRKARGKGPPKKTKKAALDKKGKGAKKVKGGEGEYVLAKL